MILHQYEDTPPCPGMNCGCTDGKSHSKECIAEHTATLAQGFFGKWIPVSAGMPAEGKYLVHSSYGVGCAYRHDPAWADCFQDIATSNDEGMLDDMGIIYRAYHYMQLPPSPNQ
jgi:hypothetical protein